MAAIYTKHKSSLRPCCHFVARTHSAQLHDMETSMDAAARLLSAGLSFGVAVLVVAEQRLMASDRRGMITRASLAARASKNPADYEPLSETHTQQPLERVCEAET